MAEKKVYGWLNSLSVWSSRKKQKHLCSCIYEEGKKTSICTYLPKLHTNCTLKKKKKENVPRTTNYFNGKFLYEHVECEN